MPINEKFSRKPFLFFPKGPNTLYPQLLITNPDTETIAIPFWGTLDFEGLRSAVLWISGTQ